MTRFVCGKPMAHWEKAAKKLVVQLLLQGASLDTRSIIGELAAKRMMELAVMESPELVDELLEERDRYQVGMARALKRMIGK